VTEDFGLSVVRRMVMNFCDENKIFISHAVTMWGQLKKHVIAKTASYLVL